VDPTAVLDDLEKIKFFTLLGLEPRPLSRPARSQSLYRLRYPGSDVVAKSAKVISEIEHRPSTSYKYLMKIFRSSHREK
jgi:hypothetical protein